MRETTLLKGKQLSITINFAFQLGSFWHAGVDELKINTFTHLLYSLATEISFLILLSGGFIFSCGLVTRIWC